ncbi:unnamed protein product [Hymenolepis diminuta]|uniref:PDZ domain-containing protein n=1 Tax=Hymenolepis diminuta TaxID=6216 RepID=A0A564YFU0_HYMDI|nr:unnamed protein product [Hymenolepis diminuta]
MERMGENLSVPQNSIMRPRDLRSSKQKTGSSFSRASAARASLGTTSYAWMEAADRVESEIAESSITWPRKNRITIISNDDLNLEYDESLLKRARQVSCKGPFSLEQSGFLFQGVVDRVMKRYWGLRITSSDFSAQNQVPLRKDEVIVKVNEENFMSKSSIELLAILIDAFSKSQVSFISVLKQQDFSVPFPSPISHDENATRPSSSTSMSPVSYIKNLNAFNTRLIGQCVTVDLHKLADGGFGISFATRDTCVNSDGMEPIFVERIMPNGAAIHDGRVQFGDRLLSVNGTQVTTFKDAMTELRSIPVGEKATLVFSRQEAVVTTTPTSTTSPVDFPTDLSRHASHSTPDLAFEPPICQKMVIKIPVPHPNSGSSSLGIRFEAWNEPRIIHAYSEYIGSDEDDGSMVGDTDNLEENLSGFFVKLIVSDGPASKGNLRPGDRLIAVNGHSVVGASPEKISTQLKSSLRKAQVKMVNREKQVFLKLTVTRFFHRYEKHDSAPKTKSILRSTTETTLDKMLTQKNRDSGRKVKVKDGSDEDDNSSDLSPRRMARTPSLDSRGRSRRDRESRSPSDSPVRCQSAFTRDGVGRRSVSEKRHAHMNATNFSIFNENVLPHRNMSDDQSRLYSTMPASRKIRQIRRSKQGRASGPIKPVHSAQSSSEASEPKESPTASKEPITLLEMAEKSNNDILRTDEIDENGAQTDQASSQGPSRSRSHNHSFRAAISKPISTSSNDQAPPPVPHKYSPDVTNLPVPTRRPKIAPPTDCRKIVGEDRSPRQVPHPAPLLSIVKSNSPSIDSNATAAASQHKAFEDFMETRKCDNKDSSCFSLPRRRSSGSFDDEDNSYKVDLLPNPSRDSNKSVILTNVRPVPSDLRRTPSPVDFNAYAREHTQIQNSSHPSKLKPSSNFLTEVETCLPKRRPVFSIDTRQREDPCCTTSDPSGTHVRGNMTDYDGYTTFPKATQQGNDPADIPLVRRPRSGEQIGYENENHMNQLSSSYAAAPIPIMKGKMDSPHAPIRSHSLAVIIRSTDYNHTASFTYPSDRMRCSPHTLIRSSKNSNSPQHRPSLNSKATNRQV